MATKHYTNRNEWDAAVEQQGLTREYLQFGQVQAVDSEGQVQAGWFGQYSVPNGQEPYGFIHVEKLK